MKHHFSKLLGQAALKAYTLQSITNKKLSASKRLLHHMLAMLKEHRDFQFSSGSLPQVRRKWESFYHLQQSYKQMQVFKALKRVIGKLDLFSSMQLLRFDGDAETKTFTGGVFSLAIIIYLLSTFSSMAFQTFNKLIITSATDTAQDSEPQPIYLLTTDNASHFMMGVEIWGFDLNSERRFFDVQLQNSFMKDGIPGQGSVSYTMQPCRKDHWKGLPNASEIYDKVEMNKWLCMPLDITPMLMGKYYSDLQTTLDITIKKCTNSSTQSRPCAPQEEIDAYMQANGPLYLTPFFLNPLINPQNKDYLKLYLEDKYYTVFGVNYGMNMYIYNAGYEITTDESILPFSSNHIENGSIVTTVLTNSFLIGSSNQSYYAFVSFFRDPSTIVMSRSYQKVVDAFSYVGGLLGSFLLVLIFVNFYNECSYEMRFACMFKREKDSPANTKQFNIIYYFLQSVYNIFNTIKMKCGNWKSVKFFHRTREEMLRQLDVKYLFKKLYFLQNSIMLLLTKPQLKGLMLQHQMTISEAKKMRRIYGMKSKFKKILRQKMRRSEEEAKRQDHIRTTVQMLPDVNKSCDKSGVIQLFPKMGKDIESPQKEKSSALRRMPLIDLSSSQSGESSESSEEEMSVINQERLIEDLNELKQQSQNNSTSATIFKQLDPSIKRFYQVASSYLSYETISSPHQRPKVSRRMPTQQIKVNGSSSSISIDPPVKQDRQQIVFTFVE